MKRCPKCQTEWEDEGFAKGQGWCKLCHKAWRVANCEKVRAINLAYMRANKDKVNQWNRESYARHRVENKIRKAEYYKENKFKIQQRAKAWKEENKDKIQFSSAKRDAFERSCQIHDLTLQQWQQLKKSYGYRCGYCRRRRRLEMDHKQPISRGGQHTLENIIPACRDCNCEKWTMTYGEYLEFCRIHKAR